MRGGSWLNGDPRTTLFPQQMVNIPRSAIAGVQGTILKWQGKPFPAPLAPLPLKNQPINNQTKVIVNPPGSIGPIWDAVQQQVSEVAPPISND
jgi:hypothetical protein